MRPGRHQKFCRTDPTARLVWERVSLALRMTALTGRSCTCSGCREGLSLPSAPEHAPRSVMTAGKILKKIDKKFVALSSLPSPLFPPRSEEHTSELQSPMYLVCRL